MTTIATTDLQLQFVNLRDKHNTFCETYRQKMKGPIKDMIDLTNETFVFVKHIVNKLNDIELELDTTKLN